MLMHSKYSNVIDIATQEVTHIQTHVHVQLYMHTQTRTHTRAIIVIIIVVSRSCMFTSGQNVQM